MTAELVTNVESIVELKPLMQPHTLGRGDAREMCAGS
jgi:hypothetical protein